MASEIDSKPWTSVMGDPINMNKAVARLAYFISSTEKKSNTDIRCELYKHLVLQVLVENEDGLLFSVEEIQGGIKKLFNDLVLETVEIQDSVIELKKSGMIVEDIKSKDEDGNIIRKYIAEKSTIYRVKEIIRSKREIKKIVLDDWLIQVEKIFDRALTLEEKEMLLEDLDIYLGFLFSERGVLTQISAYGNKEEVNEFIQILDEKPDWKKRSSDFKELRFTAIQKFLSEPDDRRATYLLELNDSAFFLSLLQIDPQLTVLFQNIFKDKKLFLDSNIVYRLLGLQNEALKGMTKRVIDASIQLGCKLLVSELSIHELNFSLQRAIEYLRANPPTSPEYENVKLQYSGDARGFIIAYWKEYVKNKTPLEHFANKYKHIRAILTEDYNIEITSDYIKEIQADPNLSEEIHKFSNYLINNYQSKNSSYAYSDSTNIPRHPALIRHDVMLMMIIKRIRGDKTSAFGDVPAWLLTADGHVINYVHKESSYVKNQLPAAIHARDWLLFLRPWLPRSKDYDRAMVALISSEHIRSFTSFSPILIDQAVRILQSYRDMTPKLAAEMLADHGIEQQLMSIEKKVERSLSEEYDVDLEKLDDKASESYIKELSTTLFEEHRNRIVESSAIKLLNEKERERANAEMQNFENEKIIRNKDVIIIQKDTEKKELLNQLVTETETVKKLTELNQERERKEKKLLLELEQAGKRNLILNRILVIMRLMLSVLLVIGSNILYDNSFRNNIINNMGFVGESAIKFLLATILFTLFIFINIGLKKTWKIIVIMDIVFGALFGLYNLYKMLINSSY